MALTKGYTKVGRGGITFSLDTRSVEKGLLRLRDNVREEVRRGVKKAAEPIIKEARRLCPVRTKQLRESIRYFPGKKKKDRIDFAVGSDLPYTIYIELGVRAHRMDQVVFIRYAPKAKHMKLGTLGRGGRIVKWKGLPEAEFRFVGRHPGIRATRFLKKALAKGKKPLVDEIKKMVRDALKKSKTRVA